VHVWVELQIRKNLEHRILFQDSMSNADLLESKLEEIIEGLHRMRVTIGSIAYWLARESINFGCRTKLTCITQLRTCGV
jgi:hypothetical protein